MYITISMLVVIMIINIFNRIVIYKQIIKENITFNILVRKVKYPTVKEEEKQKLLSDAWKIIIPFILLAIVDDSNLTLKLVAWGIICMLEAMILKKLYRGLIAYSSSSNIKKEFHQSLLKFTVLIVLLIIISILKPRNLFSYILMGLCTSEFVDLVHKQ